MEMTTTLIFSLQLYTYLGLAMIAKFIITIIYMSWIMILPHKECTIKIIKIKHKLKKN